METAWIGDYQWAEDSGGKREAYQTVSVSRYFNNPATTCFLISASPSPSKALEVMEVFRKDVIS